MINPVQRNRRKEKKKKKKKKKKRQEKKRKEKKEVFNLTLQEIGQLQRWIQRRVWKFRLTQHIVATVAESDKPGESW